MTEGEERAFRDSVDVLAVGFRVQMSPALYQALWEGLCQLPLYDVQRAIQEALRRCQYMPTVAELAELAGRGRDARPYHSEWKDPHAHVRALPPSQRRAPSPGEFREYLRGLAEKKGTNT